MNPEFEVKETSRDVAKSPVVDDLKEKQDEEARIRQNAEAQQAKHPKGVDLPDGQLESLDEDLKRVEKRTTL